MLCVTSISSYTNQSLTKGRRLHANVCDLLRWSQLGIIVMLTLPNGKANTYHPENRVLQISCSSFSMEPDLDVARDSHLLLSLQLPEKEATLYIVNLIELSVWSVFSDLTSSAISLWTITEEVSGGSSLLVVHPLMFTPHLVLLSRPAANALPAEWPSPAWSPDSIYLLG